MTNLYQPFSYGTDWILVQDNDFHFDDIQQVAVSWDWLSHPQQRTFVQGFRRSPQAYGLKGGTYWKLLNTIPESLFGVATNNPHVASCFTDRDSIKELWQLMQFLTNAERSKIVEGHILENTSRTSRAKSICVESVPPENVDVNAYQSLMICISRGKVNFPGNTAFIVTDLKQNYKRTWLRRYGLLVTAQVDKCIHYGYSLEKATPFSCFAHTMPSPELAEEHHFCVHSARPYATGELLRVWINPADPDFNELEGPIPDKANQS